MSIHGTSTYRRRIISLLLNSQTKCKSSHKIQNLTNKDQIPCLKAAPHSCL